MKPPRLTEKQLVLEFKKNKIQISQLLRKALIQSKKTHSTHIREDGSSVLEQHIYPITKTIIACYKLDKKEINHEILASALLHDVIEDDTEITSDAFKRFFGKKVYEIVMSVTKRPKDNISSLSEKEKYRINKLLIKNLKKCPIEAGIIKLADRYNNLICTISLGKTNSLKYKRYIIEAKEIFLPLAKELSPYFYKRIKYALDTVS